MNGNTWKAIAAGIAIALAGALWTGNAKLASMETGIKYISKQVDSIAADTKANTNRISDLERARPGRFGERL